MFKKICIILHNFFKSAKKKELVEVLILPMICTILLYIFLNDRIYKFSDFSKDFNSTVISITSLLSAFGLAAVSILITSSSENVIKADKQMTNRFDRNNKKVSYYRLQIYRSFFSLIIQVVLLGISIIFKFLCEIDFAIYIVFYFEVYMLIVAILSQILTIVSMYYLFITIKRDN